MKKQLIVIALTALLALVFTLGAQAVYHYSLNDTGIFFSGSQSFAEVVNDQAGGTHLVAVCSPTSTGCTSAGITPYFAWVNGIAGQSANIPYLRPDGTTGTLVFNGGLFREALDGNVPASAIDAAEADRLAEKLRRNGTLRR